MRNSDNHLEEFKELGYTVFEGVFGAEAMEPWKARYDDLVERNTLFDADEPNHWLGSLVEAEPRLMLPAVNNPIMLDFAERVLGPFVQLDNLTLTAFPSVSPEEAKGRVSGWHRDRWASFTDGSDYRRPWACNAICYLQDMSDAFGPLRVVAGSHRNQVTVTREDMFTPHPDERLLHVKAGDVVFTHSSLLHSGTPNTTGERRFFLSTYYSHCGLRPTDNHDGPNVQKIIKRAREQNDRRLMRLFGVDELLVRRANSAFLLPDEEMWDRWISEDRAALKA